jgi:hypothetical protein
VESNFDINAIGDKNTAFGLCQRRWDRLKKLKYYASDKWINWKDFYIQLDFIQQETSWWTKWFEKKFLEATSVEQASSFFDQWYERSNWKHRKDRINYAINFNKKTEKYIV